MSELRNKIIELRINGKKYTEISEILGCSKSTISYHCKRNKKIIYIENVDIESQTEIVEYREIGLRLIEIYEKLEKRITKENIKIICRKNGLSYLDRLNEEDINKIREKYKEIGKLRKVARILGYSFSTVKKNVIDLIEDFNKNKKNISNSESVINWRKRVKIKLVEYKGGKCERCGYNKYVEVLEFHHRDEYEKDFTISGKSWSYERLKNEVDKCIMLCSNCHKEMHIENKN